MLQGRDDRPAHAEEFVMVLGQTPIGEKQLPGFEGAFRGLKVKKGKTFDAVVGLRRLDLIPNFGETACIAACEILPGDDPLLLQAGERLIEPIAVGRRVPFGFLDAMGISDLSDDPRDVGSEVVAFRFVVEDSDRIFDDLSSGSKPRAILRETNALISSKRSATMSSLSSIEKERPGC